jgi:hypothetical protein
VHGQQRLAGSRTAAADHDLVGMEAVDRVGRDTSALSDVDS